MKEKHLVILETIIIFVLMVGAIIFKFIPEYKASQGSSDIYIDTDSYQDIVEFKVNDKPNFALVTKDSKITNILFFDQESLCLYNQNIENTSISKGLKSLVELLIENNYIKQHSTITLTNYKNKSFNQVKKSLQEQINILKIDITISETSSSIKKKAEEINITGSDEITLLKEIELYSKEIIRRDKNNVSSTTTTTKPQVELDETSSREYTDNVYKKIEVYMRNNNITNQEVTNTTLQITKIPANKEGTLFPDKESWYYIKDSKVYAYISITQNNNNYSYCYQASIDEYKKGQC